MLGDDPRRAREGPDGFLTGLRVRLLPGIVAGCTSLAVVAVAQATIGPPVEISILDDNGGATPPALGGLSGATATSPAGPYPMYPQAGRFFEDLIPANFFDLDSGAGRLDWDCTNWTYDGHTGVDTALRSFEQQDANVPVFALLDGTVVARHDGEDDRNTTAAGQPSNYVVLEHDPDFFSRYWHLKNNSVGVTLGQQVVAGQPIGLVGSGGASNGPHLHLSLQDGVSAYLDDFESFTGPCNPGASPWGDQEPIDRSMRVIDFTYTTDELGSWAWPEAVTRTGSFEFSFSAQTVRAALLITNLPANSTWEADFIDPSGWTVWVEGPTTHTHAAFNFVYVPLESTLALDDPGTWAVRIIVEGQTLLEAPFEVVSPGGIVNRIPAEIGVVLVPDNPATDDVIACRVTGPHVLDDPDYDLVRYHYRWQVNGSDVREVVTAARSDLLKRSVAPPLSIVSCFVSALDDQVERLPEYAQVEIAANVGPLLGAPGLAVVVLSLALLGGVVARRHAAARSR